MRWFILEKTRETTFWLDGQVWERTDRYENADRYVSPDGNQSLVLEQHALLEAAESWR